MWEGEEKKKKLEEMKKEAKEYIGDDDDFTLVRFLIARQWDVKKATEMYTASKKWRNKMVCFLDVRSAGAVNAEQLRNDLGSHFLDFLALSSPITETLAFDFPFRRCCSGCKS